MKAIRILLLIGSFALTSFYFKTPNHPFAPPVPTREDNLSLGNPSGATNDVSMKQNFLIRKTDYTVSYNNDLGHPNWVSWHLDSAWFGTKDRCDCFRPDITLPNGFTQITTDDYAKSGFDRGHLCPSADRTKTSAENKETFLMINIFPQSPNFNQRVWGDLEDYCRKKLVGKGNECYIIAGGHGRGGQSDYCETIQSIGDGRVNVPALCWKIIVTLKEGRNDLTRIDRNTRVIAVLMPNTQASYRKDWSDYRVSVDSLEKITGYDFLSKLPVMVQDVIEAKVDNIAIN